MVIFDQLSCCQLSLKITKKGCHESSVQYTGLQQKQTPLSLGHYSTSMAVIVKNHKKVASTQTRISGFPQVSEISNVWFNLMLGGSMLSRVSSKESLK